ncbi:MAG: histidine kinase dimerization/phosphoacceptor domain -containing protein [Acidobacteriota bacterium]|nr:histidine kinase dimerization/phosphoacceptor domain -containing protein [Acidobacteriota bacterium]
MKTKEREAKKEATLKALRESEARYRVLFSGVPDGILLADPQSRQFRFANPAICRMLGYTEEELLRLGVTDIHPKESLERVLCEFAAPSRGEAALSPDLPCLRKDGTLIYADISHSTMIIDGQVHQAAFFHDITGRKRAEEEIKRQLLEKEILLKEVHHRIKNNIAAIEGLLSLHAQSVSNPEAGAALQEAISRVHSMRLLYDKLLFSEGYTDIPVKNYTEALIASIVALFPGGARIVIDQRIADFNLDAKRMFPLAIIINELLTNTMKYAFINRDSGVINISLTNAEKKVTLTVEDDGNGFFHGFEISESKGFGLMLVKLLSQQLGGSFSLGKEAGARYKIEFAI